MMCERCGKNRAVIHSYCISDNKLIDLHFCEECDKLQDADDVQCNDDCMQNLLEGLLQSTRGEQYAVIESKCEVVKNRLVGCPNCYEIFFDIIDTYIGGSSHSYKRFESKDGESEQLQVLRGDLQEAVLKEDFEKAAQLRDSISRIEKDGFLGDY
jgi:protein arginine kinase activator